MVPKGHNAVIRLSTIFSHIESYYLFFVILFFY